MSPQDRTPARRLCLVILPLLGACTTGSPRLSALDGGGDLAATYLNVENNNPSELQIYWLQGDSRFSLGRVRGLSSARIRIPPALLVTGMASLLAEERPRNLGRQYRSRAFPISPGQRIEWSLETTLASSRLSIRSPIPTPLSGEIRPAQ